MGRLRRDEQAVARAVQVDQPDPPGTRYDSLGRRIGRNWWREWNTDLLFNATAHWERECEEAAIGYETEIAEFAAEHPRPTLKEFLETNRGMAAMRMMGD